MKKKGFVAKKGPNQRLHWIDLDFCKEIFAIFMLLLYWLKYGLLVKVSAFGTVAQLLNAQSRFVRELVIKLLLMFYLQHILIIRLKL